MFEGGCGMGRGRVLVVNRVLCAVPMPKDAAVARIDPRKELVQKRVTIIFGRVGHEHAGVISESIYSLQILALRLLFFRFIGCRRSVSPMPVTWFFLHLPSDQCLSWRCHAPYHDLSWGVAENRCGLGEVAERNR